jgi:hypothetical protein
VLVATGALVEWPNGALALVRRVDSLLTGQVGPLPLSMERTADRVLVATGALVEWPNGALALVRRVDRQPVRLAGG